MEGWGLTDVVRVPTLHSSCLPPQLSGWIAPTLGLLGRRG